MIHGVPPPTSPIPPQDRLQLLLQRFHRLRAGDVASEGAVEGAGDAGGDLHVEGRDRARPDVRDGLSAEGDHGHRLEDLLVVVEAAQRGQEAAVEGAASLLGDCGMPCLLMSALACYDAAEYVKRNPLASSSRPKSTRTGWRWDSFVLIRPHSTLSLDSSLTPPERRVATFPPNSPADSRYTRATLH